MEDTKQKIGIPESWIGLVRKGNQQGLLETTLNKNVTNYLGIKQGDKIKIWIKKVHKTT